MEPMLASLIQGNCIDVQKYENSITKGSYLANFKRPHIVYYQGSVMDIYAVVKRKRKTRKGKGFSRAELRDVGLSPNEALKLAIPIDTRRSTKHENNVTTLKTYIEEL